jgi:hypothetical protein
MDYPCPPFLTSKKRQKTHPGPAKPHCASPAKKIPQKMSPAPLRAQGCTLNVPKLAYLIPRHQAIRIFTIIPKDPRFRPLIINNIAVEFMLQTQIHISLAVPFRDIPRIASTGVAAANETKFLQSFSLSV